MSGVFIVCFHLVIQVDSVAKEFADRLRSSSRQPLIERLRVVAEKPFDVDLGRLRLTVFVEAVENDVIFDAGLDHFRQPHFADFHPDRDVED